MRTALCSLLLLLAVPAEAAEFVPPDIAITGTPARPITKAEVGIRFKAAKPECAARARALAQGEGETPEHYMAGQKILYIFCFAEEFAAEGLSAFEDVPKALRTKG